MKKIALGLILALMMTGFAACSGDEGDINSNTSGETAPMVDQLEANQILSVQQINTGKYLTIGDSEELAADVVGEQGRNTVNFQSTGVVMHDYADAEGILLSWLDGELVGFGINNEDWTISSGARVGMTREEVLALYADNELADEGENDLVICYDKAMNPIAYTPDAYYMVTITFQGEDGETDYIGLQTGIAKEKAAAASPTQE